MALTKSYGVEIVGMETIIPTAIEDNLQLDLISKEESESIVAHTGIRFRRVVKNHEFGIKDFLKRELTYYFPKLIGVKIR